MGNIIHEKLYLTPSTLLVKIRNFFLLLLPFIASSVAFAQNTNQTKQQSLVKIGLLGPNIIYEAKINHHITLNMGLGAALGFGYGGELTGSEFDYGLLVEISPRYYYNLDNRVEDGKKIKNYAGNFVSIVSQNSIYTLFPNVDEPNNYTFGLTWGLQRNLGKGWYYNFEVGPAGSFSNKEAVLDLILGVNIGFRL